MRKYYVRKIDKDLIMLLQEDENYQWYFNQYETNRYMWAEDYYSILEGYPNDLDEMWDL